ncbi:hypothetical protein LUZ60_000540 [Juncus effusus]|nr:hypothetical protein LUZ60_000540 [Juncus effusus]
MVVLYTWVAMGHLVPTVEFAKLLWKHDLSVMVVIVDPDSALPSKTISGLSSVNPSISFHVIPPASIPAPASASRVGEFAGLLERIRYANTPFTYLVQSLSETYSVRAIVIDFFLTYALDVAHKLYIPAYFFFCSGAADLALYLHVPVLDSTLSKDLKDMRSTLMHLPGLPPIPASQFPGPLLTHNDPLYQTMIYHFARLPQADGILVNTFESLEMRAVEALRDGLCLPDMNTPPIYCIGPLISKGENKTEQRHECLTWLDNQPKKSVVYLSFGSLGSLPIDQLKEIAIGLDNSSQRFIWVVRGLPSTDPSKRVDPRPQPLGDLNEILPKGFLDRTKNRGLVVKSWVPQVEILNHSSVAGFVTHCGWNSILEAVTAGIPMICWPLFAEQKVNKILLTNEMKIAVEMTGYDEDLVPAKEVEEKVRLIMESEEGKVIRQKMEGLKEKAAEAMWKNGSSNAALMDFLAAVVKDYDEVNY